MKKVISLTEVLTSVITDLSGHEIESTDTIEVVISCLKSGTLRRKGIRPILQIDVPEECLEPCKFKSRKDVPFYQVLAVVDYEGFNFIVMDDFYSYKGELGDADALWAHYKTHYHIFNDIKYVAEGSAGPQTINTTYRIDWRIVK